MHGGQGKSVSGIFSGTSLDVSHRLLTPCFDSMVFLAHGSTCHQQPGGGLLHCCWQVLAVAEKRKTALKRKISALQVSSKEKLEEAEKKMTKIHSQASKLPNLSNMLKAAFM